MKGRLSGRGVGWKVSRFETLYRYNIVAGPKLEGEVCRGAREDSERAGIMGSKRRKGGITTDLNMRGILESGRNGKRRWGRSRNMMLSGREGKEGGERKEGGGKGRRGW